MDACHRVDHVCRLGQVTDDDFGAEFAQRIRSGVVVVNQRAHPVPTRAQQLNHLSADTTRAAAGAGDQIQGRTHARSFRRERTRLHTLRIVI
jgi:hypothetical protein